jgi:hypothetical protein
MKDKTNKLTRVMVPVVFLLLISCVSIPKKQPPSLPVELRADLGRIGIVSASFQPEVRLRKPMTKGAAAWHGAVEGAEAALRFPCNNIGCAGFLALVPVFAAVGSVAGAIMGVPPQKIKETEDALSDCLATLNFQETMRERFFREAREQTQYPFLLLEVQGPTVLDEEVTYGSLSDKGIDTILEIGLRKFELWGEKDSINLPLDLLMAAGIRLIRVADGLVLFSRNFVYDYVSVPLKFSEWGANNAQPFREELDRAFQYLATEIVKTLSMIQTPLEYVSFLPVVVPIVWVDIDIIPADRDNNIYLRSMKTISVAILFSTDFPAPDEEIVQAEDTLTFGRTGKEVSLIGCTRKLKDVNRDGKKDLVCQFLTVDAGFQSTDTVGVLKGKTTTGRSFEGSDKVRVLRYK